MPRIRTIKPEFPEDETLGAVSRDARLLFVLCWTRCDDHGRFRASPVLLRGQLYPYDDDLSTQAVAGWLTELSDAGRLHLYEVDGQSYGEVVNWTKHQRIDNASKPIHPEPRGEPRRTAANLGDSPLDLDLDLDQERDPDRAPEGTAADEFWPEVWKTYADKVCRSSANVKNPGAFKRKVQRNAESEHGERARDLAAKWELTAYQLGSVLAGEESILVSAPRRVA